MRRRRGLRGQEAARWQRKWDGAAADAIEDLIVAAVRRRAADEPEGGDPFLRERG